MSHNIQDTDALLTRFEQSKWRELYVRSSTMEIYAAKPGLHAHNPMLRRESTPVPAHQPASAPAQIALKAPHLGTFHPAVATGAAVTGDTVVGFLQLLDERHEIRAGQAGRINAFAAAAGELVEYDQDLLTINLAA
jgi:biotin carboxyl carrier protein